MADSRHDHARRQLERRDGSLRQRRVPLDPEFEQLDAPVGEDGGVEGAGGHDDPFYGVRELRLGPDDVAYSEMLPEAVGAASASARA